MEFTPILIRLLLLWLMMLLMGNGCYGCLEQERIALLQLKASINHTNLSFDSFVSWEEEGITDCCEWKGVECHNTTHRVLKLYLNYISRDWSYLNTSMFLSFESLTSLDLSDNSLRGYVENEGFEKLSRLKNLYVLILSFNEFNNSILSSLNQLSTLKTLDLGHNKLNGTIHIKDLDGLNNLKKLDISRNNLNSIIINQAGVEGTPILKNLEVLDMSYNEFDNKIWSFVTELPSIKTLYLRGMSNRFNGPIHSQAELQNLGNIKNLFFDDAILSNDFLPSIHAVMISLRVLSLRYCGLTGNLRVQGLCELRNLQELDLMGNGLEGPLPGCLANLTSLRLLDISSNRFTGNIDKSSPLVHLTSLEFLALSSNSFQIPISFRSFFNHSKLKYIESLKNELLAETKFHIVAPSFQLAVFRLSDHTLGNVSSTRAFPDFLYYQKNLQGVELSRIYFNGGKFPSWLLENNTGLITLLLPDNSLTGHFQLPFGSKTRLITLDISKNQFYGHIPDNIAIAFPSLIFLNISGNGFGGSIPSSLGDMSSLRFLDLSNNQLSQGIPEHLAMGCISLSFLKLSHNNLQGPILPTKNNLTMLWALYLDHNHFTEISNSLSNCSQLSTLNISQNHLSGKLPVWMGSMSEYLSEIDMSNNHLEGPIPTEFCQLHDLFLFDLSANNITGNIPACFNPPYIKHVHLSKNRLQGPLPHAFYNSSSLVTIDLSRNHLTGRIPSWIGTLSRLSIFLLKSNHFEGEIPISLCHMSRLSLIDFSYNNFSGHIPSCLSNISFMGIEKNFAENFTISRFFYYTSFLEDLKLMSKTTGDFFEDSHSFDAQLQVAFTTKGMSLSYKGINLDLFSAIDLSCNKLTGHIPNEVGNIGQIRALNLSHNGLSGMIPTTFSNLLNIESLDLSFNNFSGQIPSQLTELYFLAKFNLSYNNLSGSIPQSQRFVQFDTFDNSSYIGNPLLCGPPLSTTCNAIERPRVIMNSSEVDYGFMDMESFYVSFTISYITMFLGIVVVFLHQSLLETGMDSSG